MTSLQWRQRYTLVRAGGDTAPLQDSNPILLSYTGEGTTSTSFLSAHYSSLELVEDSRFLRHLRGETVPLHLPELPLGHCPPGSTLLGFNTTQTQHFLSLTFNTHHIKQSRIQQ